jgi:hypothetical protein
MVIWGMDSRSLLFTLVQLLLRPGYLISDYISGKRQASFPPVKMLLLVAIVFLIAATLKDSTPIDEKDIHSSFDLFGKWTYNNPGWSMMAFGCLFLLPTWLLYRNAPKHRKHTLPEGFFIQVFMATLFTIIGILSTLCNSLYLLLLWGFYYLIAYRQLFGYSWWGTFWRLCICIWAATTTLLDLVEFGNHLLHFGTGPIKQILYANGTAIFLVLIGLLVDYHIIQRTWSRFVNSLRKCIRLMSKYRTEIEKKIRKTC